MLAANRFNSLVAIRLPEDADNFFGAVELLFYEYFLLGKSKKYSHHKRCKSMRSGQAQAAFSMGSIGGLGDLLVGHGR